MGKKRIILLGCLIFSLSLSGLGQIRQSAPLSAEARISVITTSPGEDLYTVFGHAAIRITDPILNIDWVYGYGEFDFNTPNFYPEFVRGTLLYTISKDPFALFRQEFLSEPYQMKEQVLALDSNQKQNVYNILEKNILPENRLYRYDFFYDNCSTRIRDVLNKATPGSLLFSKTSTNASPSFRDLIKTYLIDRPWIRLGTDIILGMPADKHLSPSQESFLPFYLSYYLSQAKLSNQENLVSHQSYILNNKALKEPMPVFTPTAWFWFLFLFSVLGVFYPQFGKIIASMLYSLCGILGFIILYLWLGTERSSYGLNLNVLWASPLLLLLLFSNGFFKTRLSIISLVSIFLLYLSMILKIQVIHPAIVPISLMLVLYISRPFFPLLRGLSKES